MDPRTAQCRSCPDGTVVRGVNAWGVESCIRCGEGLTAVHGTQCITSCQYRSGDGRQYDFAPLSGYVIDYQELRCHIHYYFDTKIAPRNA